MIHDRLVCWSLKEVMKLIKLSIYNFLCSAYDIQRLETTMKAGAVPQAPQFKEHILFPPKEPASTDHGLDPLSFGVNTKEDGSKLKSEKNLSSLESQIQQQKIVLFLQWSTPQ